LTIIGAAPATGRRKTPPVRGRRRWTFDRISLFVVFLVLPFLGYLTLVIYPFLQAAYYSLTSWSGFTATQDFIGLDNYTRLLGDATFLKAVGNSLTLLLVVPLLTLVLSFALACLVTFGGSSTGGVRGLRGSSFYRVVSFFPYIVPAIATGIIFAAVYDPSAGLLNGILTGLGFDSAENYPWLGDASTAMAVTVAVIVWTFVGFYTVLFVAAIKGIPAETFEAARLDGAGRLRTAVSIAAPSMTGAVRSAYIYLGIFALDAFVFVSVLNPGGGPQNSTLVITQQIYSTAFRQGRFGLACAMGVLLAVITFVFVGIVFAVGKFLGREKRPLGREEKAEALR
jgi:N-acetylglucosamine transport system permease protein